MALVCDCEQRVGKLSPAEDCNRLLTNVQRERLNNSLAPIGPTALANLRAGIQNWGVDRFSKELRQHFQLVTRAFPLWSVSNLAARNALPLAPAVFDLLVVDEASQCDIASVVPLLVRSKRAVFAGDPMQLRHISKMEDSVHRTLLEQHDLKDHPVQRFTYQVNSAFDLANANSSVPDAARVGLDLHFRSHELIAVIAMRHFRPKRYTSSL